MEPNSVSAGRSRRARLPRLPPGRALQSNGSRLVLDLTGVKYNQSIPDARFEYDPPPVANVQDDFLFDSSE